jgi:hypothetical protein
MKRSITRPRTLISVAALAVVAAMCTVSTAKAAPSASAAPHEPAASSTQCNFVETLKTCESTDPTVAYTDNANGDTSHCTFVFNVTWGDGGTTTTTVTDPTDGPHLLAQHTYAGPKVYTITVTVQVTAGNCTGTNSVHTFTLLKPPPSPVPPSQSDSWAGYVAANSGPYHHVQATWKMPGNKGTKAQTAITSFWVGFDGDTASPDNIEQCGTEILEAPSGLIGYTAFYEVGLQAGAIKHPPIAASPGDSITAVANYAHGAFQCTLSIRHHGVVKTWSTGPIKGNFPLKTAEVITEANGHSGSIPLAPFGTVQYTNVNLGGQGTIYPVAMYTIDGLFEAVSTSPFQGSTTNGSFSNQYIRSEAGLLRTVFQDYCPLTEWPRRITPGHRKAEALGAEQQAPTHAASYYLRLASRLRIKRTP